MKPFGPKHVAALALAAGLALPASLASAQDLTIATSLPALEFPFFVHMQKELIKEADQAGGIADQHRRPELDAEADR